MSIVRINAIEVPEGMGEMLEGRFAQRAGEVDKVPGFEGFDLLRPTDESNTYYVITRWTDEAAFDGWLNSPAFQQGHASEKPAGAEGGGHPGGHPGAEGSDRPAPVGTGSKLLSFDVVLSVSPAS
ncbi:MAG: antibiotic biosynthesis monooxygenase [Acidimicrobiales bacterium]